MKMKNKTMTAIKKKFGDIECVKISSVIGFKKWLTGQTCPLIAEDKDPYDWAYAWDYDAYKSSIVKSKAKKDYHAPKRWDTDKIVQKVAGLGAKIKEVQKHSKEWYVLQMKREIAGVKKHIINLEKLTDSYENK